MSGVGFFELVILFMIGLVVLGPQRLPKVANQLGTWIGQARRMTRVMKRQLEDELDADVLAAVGSGGVTGPGAGHHQRRRRPDADPEGLVDPDVRAVGLPVCVEHHPPVDGSSAAVEGVTRWWACGRTGVAS